MSDAPKKRKIGRDDAPWITMPAWDTPDAVALQYLARGEASPEQQQRALNWIIYQAAGTYDFPYRPGADGERDTNLALGRMFVGQQIIKLLKVDISKISQIRKRREHPDDGSDLV